jgi:hypothetical protein
MAILHPQTYLRPSKLELLTRWLPTRTWYRGDEVPELARVASFRFDDPDGEVGIETLLIHAGGGLLYQIPLTYRGAPLQGGAESLVGTSEHGVLGPRWIYDGCVDPVYATTLATAILTGGSGAEELASVDGGYERREPSMTVRGSGTLDEPPLSIETIVRVADDDPTVIVADSMRITIRRTVDRSNMTAPAQARVLTGVWGDNSAPVLLAWVNYE